MKERKCINCMYSDEWDSTGFGECQGICYIAFVRADMVCKRHRFNEEDEGITILEISAFDSLHDI